MIQLNNKYTMDGKIPIHIAEFSGCSEDTTGRGAWNGRFSERSGNTARKVSVKEHIRKYSRADSKQGRFGF